jgi:phosphoserine aminotransferase
VSKYGIIYAGAQKNIGPSGVTIVIIREDLIGKTEGLPSMLDYKIYAENSSLFNTPPTYAIYIAKLVFELMESMGGVDATHRVNKEKAGMVYDAIDNSQLFKAHVQKSSDRSIMNIPFFASSDEINKKFIAEAGEVGLKTLKGHRSVGGMRASIYNAMPIEGCKKLVEFIKNFDEANS